MSDVTEIVNATLDRVRYERKLNEEQLAAALDLDPTTLWRWRKGKSLGKLGTVLIPLIAQFAPKTPQ